MKTRIDPLGSLIDRVDELDAASKANLISRLARERHLLNMVMNTIREGIIVVESSGMVEYANPSSRDMLGIAERDIGNLSLWRAVPDLARTLRMSEKGILIEEANISREIELTYPQRRIVRLYLVPIEEPREKVQLARYAVILSDITQEQDRTRQEIEDERVNSILELAAGVAHELGNPLNSLNIHLQVMQRQLQKMKQTDGLEKLGKSMEVCAGEVERLDSIITHFLEAVRPREPDLHDMDVIAPLEESIEFLGPELEGAGVRVDIELDSSLPLVQGDRDQVKQVFFNIIKNARQAMTAGGIIKIRAFADDEFVYIQIGDTGEGIPQENLRKVFQPYFSTKREGHGLGMMIVERIMRDHGGQIGIDSRPSVGTLVTLQFPQKHRRIRLLKDR
ncbi:MAG: nitrogen regulation protein NR(II) [Puniceicoccaceae bacterium]